MADERYRFIVETAFNPGNAVREAAGTADEILRVFQRLRSQNIDILDTRSIQNFQRELRTAVERALGVDLRQSPLFQSMRQIDQRAVAGTTPTQTSAFLSEQIRLTQAELQRQLVQARSRIPLGATREVAGFGTLKGYSSEVERTQAQISAAKGVEDANRALEKAKQREVDASIRAAAQIRKAIDEDARIQRREEEAKAREIAAILRRTQAEEKAAEREARAGGIATARNLRSMLQDLSAEDADRLARQFQPTYERPDRSTRLGRAQYEVSNAERALFIAEQDLARIRQSQTRTAQQILAAEGKVLAASTALAAAREKIAVLEQPPPTGGIRQQFIRGFRGESDMPYAQQLGQAFKFSVFYGTAYNLLFKFTQTLQQTVQEGIEFQQAVTELTLATGMAKEQAEAIAENLGDIATEAGFAPSQGVLAGARGVGLYGATTADEATQRRIAELAAQTATRIAFNSGMQLDDVQTRLAAITNAFQLGPEGQGRVADLDAYFARRFGVAPGATIRTVAEAGTVGQAAGFDLEAVNAIAALLMGRTGQTDSAVAGFMAQIFSRGGEGSLTSVTGKYGIDPTLELAEQMRQLADIYKEATPNERTEIAAAFGRGKVQNAGIVLLENFDEVMRAADAARGGAANGASDRSFQERLNNLGGQIQLTVAVLKDFANTLGETGLLHVIGAGVLAFRELVEIATSLLGVWNELPGAVRAVIAGFTVLAAAQRSYAAGGLVAGLLGRQSAGAHALANPGILGGLGRALPSTAFAGGRLGGLVAGGAGATFGAAALPAAAVTAAVAGLVAVAKLKDTSDELAQAQQSASDALNSGTLSPTASPDEIRGRAESLRATEKEVRDAAGGFLANIVGLGSEKQEALAQADRLSAEARRLERLAKLQESAFESRAVDPKRGLITSFDAEGLSKAMEDITNTGGTAQTRLDALSESLRGFGAAATRAKESFDAQLFASQQAGPVLETIKGSGQLLRDTPTMGDLLRGAFTLGIQGPSTNRDWQNVLPDEVEKVLSGPEVQKRMREQLSSLTSLAELTPEKAKAIAEGVIGTAAQQIGEANDLPRESVDQLHNLMVDSVAEYLTGQARATLDAVRGSVVLSPAELTNVINQITQDTQGALGAKPQSDYAGRIQLLRRSIADIRNAALASGQGITPQAAEEIQKLQSQIAENQIARLENLRKIAQAGAKSEAEYIKIGKSFFQREARAAIRAGDQDALVGLVAAAGAYGRRMANELLDTAIRVQRQVAAAREAMLAQLEGTINRLGGLYGTAGRMAEYGIGADAPKKLNRLQRLKDAIAETPSALPGQDQFTDGWDDLVGQSEELAETAAQRRAALAQARAVRSESAIQQARADIQAARADMAAAEKGTVEYYNALSAFYAAQNALDDAIAAYRENRFLLAHDITDPVDQARASLRSALLRLRQDRGKPADTIAADRVEVQRAQAELEAQKFQQRLQSVQTAEELGRISHARYIRYLENEHDRLNRIKNRTYQQQQQLDEIDRLLKTASDSMNAQWNFGDIKLPTPYQIRRRTEELFGDPRDNRPESVWEPANVREGDVNIQVNGADTRMVTQIISDVLARHSRTRSTRTRSR